MEPPRAPAPRPRPSPSPSPSSSSSYISLVNMSPQLSSYLRQSGLQSPSSFSLNSPRVTHGSHYSTDMSNLPKINTDTFNPPPGASTQLTSTDVSHKPLTIYDRLQLTPQSGKFTGDMIYTPTHNSSTQSQSGGNVPNPHSSIVPQTPIISGPSQAKNSIKLQNCVSTVNLQCELKLLDIYCKTRFSEYNPSRFHGVVMKILEPRATALVFRSGKLVCTGAKNEHDSLLATRKFSRIIKKLGFPVTFTEFKIQNLVATGDLRFPIKLEALQQAHGQFTSYEPELFPGLIYRMIRPRIVLLIFVNGKIVFTGAKSREDIDESLNIIYPILRSFKKN